MKNTIYDVIVSGGGLAGVASSIAAGREGLNVLLIERYGFLGGMATAGLVNPFTPYCTWESKWNSDWTEIATKWKPDWSDIVNKGIFELIIVELGKLDQLHSDKVTFNEEALKIVLDRLLNRFNVKVLFHSTVLGADKEDYKITSIQVGNKKGISLYSALYYIDATGDADLSFFSGCRYEIGREFDGRCQPMTLCFKLANVDTAKFDLPRHQKTINRIYSDFKARGLLRNPMNGVIIHSTIEKGVFHFNSTRIHNKIAIEPVEFSEAEIEGREQVYELYIFLKENIDGFENCQLSVIAPQVGVRETRRIISDYVISAEDILSCRKFDDSIARGTWPVEIHNPTGGKIEIRQIKPGDYYTVPYRSLVPNEIGNLLVVGRPVSSSHEAHSALRVMSTCTCIGEAGGTAVAIAAKTGTTLKDVDSSSIQMKLKENSALY